MSLHNPFDPNVALHAGCNCGHHDSQAEHELAEAEALNRRVIETTASPPRS